MLIVERIKGWWNGRKGGSSDFVDQEYLNNQEELERLKNSPNNRGRPENFQLIGGEVLVVYGDGKCVRFNRNGGPLGLASPGSGVFNYYELSDEGKKAFLELLNPEQTELFNSFLGGSDGSVEAGS